MQWRGTEHEGLWARLGQVLSEEISGLRYWPIFFYVRTRQGDARSPQISEDVSISLFFGLRRGRKQYWAQNAKDIVEKIVKYAWPMVNWTSNKKEIVIPTRRLNLHMYAKKIVSDDTTNPENVQQTLGRIGYQLPRAWIYAREDRYYRRDSCSSGAIERRKLLEKSVDTQHDQVNDFLHDYSDVLRDLG